MTAGFEPLTKENCSMSMLDWLDCGVGEMEDLVEVGVVGGVVGVGVGGAAAAALDVGATKRLAVGTVP